MRCELALYLASQSATSIFLLALRASRVALSEARAEAPTAAYCSCKSCCARADQGMSSQSRAIQVVLRSIPEVGFGDGVLEAGEECGFEDCIVKEGAARSGIARAGCGFG